MHQCAKDVPHQLINSAVIGTDMHTHPPLKTPTFLDLILKYLAIYM